MKGHPAHAHRNERRNVKRRAAKSLRITEKELSKLVKRLNQEKYEEENKMYIEGIMDGHIYAQCASYPDLIEAVNCDVYNESDTKDYSPSPTSEVGGYFRDKFDELKDMGIVESYTDIEYTEWEWGWKNGILEYWEQVEQLIK